MSDRKYTAYDRAYQARPAEVAKRVKRNAARAEMEKAGRVSKGDGKDVHHNKSLDSGGGNGKGNLAVVSKSANRSKK